MTDGRMLGNVGPTVRGTAHDTEAVPHVKTVWLRAGAGVEDVSYHRFGVGDRLRTGLARHHPGARLLRHWPDLRIRLEVDANGLPGDGGLLCEVKGRPMRDTGNLSIEQDGRWACQWAARVEGVPCMIVWQCFDGTYRACWADEVRPERVLDQWEGRENGRGSGSITELLSVSAPYLRPFEAWADTLWLDWQQPSYRCVWCGRVTYHPDDVAERYCPCCGSANAVLPKRCPHRPPAAGSSG